MLCLTNGLLFYFGTTVGHNPLSSLKGLGHRRKENPTVFFLPVFDKCNEVSHQNAMVDIRCVECSKYIWNVLYENGSCGFYFIT